MGMRTCVSPEGCFTYGIHRPGFNVKNLRGEAVPSSLGMLENGQVIDNRANFPSDDVDVQRSDIIYEIPNPFPFKGTTYISKHFADINAANPSNITLPDSREVSLAKAIERWSDPGGSTKAKLQGLYATLPEPLLLALATTSTDPMEVTHLAEMSCRFVHDKVTGKPTGLNYHTDETGHPAADIQNYPMFKALANNAHLPAHYRRIMVLKPGAQGDSEIVGEWRSGDNESHVYEYFRRNSYIPWGHYAANMAEDAIRYHARDLARSDMTGMRHLYYQRTYIRMADQVGVPVAITPGINLNEDKLEELRCQVVDAVAGGVHREKSHFTGTLWGWNYGFDYTPAGYRMHGSHQQIHQQYALIPATVRGDDGPISAFACGDLIKTFTGEFRRQTGKPFFECYIRALRENRRMDGKAGSHRLVVHEDDNVMLFVPKAQTSQWELQVMTVKPVGNILEADSGTRKSLDLAILMAVRTLSAMGAKMITGIEYSKRFDNPDTDQRLLYAFLPRLPQSPGAFSEAQLRWINRHYPEDFAAVCKERLAGVLEAGGLNDSKSMQYDCKLI